MNYLMPVDPPSIHGLEHTLGLKGEKLNPDHIDMHHITPVIDVGNGGFSRFYDPSNTMYKQTNHSLGNGTLSSVDRWIISYMNNQAPLNGDMVYRQNCSLRIIALDYLIRIEDALAALWERSFRILFSLYRAGSVAPDVVPIYRADHVIRTQFAAAGVLPKYYNYSGECTVNQWTTWDPAGAPFTWASYTQTTQNQNRWPIIPCGWHLQMSLLTNCMPSPDVSYFTFPINSYVDVRVLAQQVPNGAPIPNYW